MQLKPIARVVCGAVVVSCSSPPPASHGPVTFHRDVEPILQASCQPCHVKGGIAPFALSTYRDAKPYAALIASQTSAGTMPPWGAVENPGCTPRFKWKNDVRLTPAAIATLAAWREDPIEGDPRDAPRPIVPAPVALDGAQLELATAAPYSIADPGADQFRCFVLDPALATTSYVNGSFVVPGNPTIVHHAIVFADPARASEALVTDAATRSYDCFGGPGFSNTTLVTAWAPGGVPVEYPSDVGAQLDPGTLLVMQVHYHPHSATASLAPDQTKLQLRFTPSTPGHLAQAVLVGNFGSPVATTGKLAGTGLLPGPDDPPTGPVFDIPANVKGHVEAMQITVPAGSNPIRILGVGGHSHYVGSSIDITLTHAHPARQAAAQNECLLSIPKWDFNWQRIYAYDTSLDATPTAAAGDIIRIACTYDNTMGNPRLAASLQERGLTAPEEVKLGETTLDEMCLGAFLIIP